MRIILVFQIIIFLIFMAGCSRIVYRDQRVKAVDPEFEQKIHDLYTELQLEPRLRFEIFRMALIGHSNVEFENDIILTIIDFSKPSTEKRCLIIDLQKKQLLYNTFIAHGSNSGENFATVFSNTPGSRQSSLGFFRTAETYEGSNGYSLKLDGLEKDINHLARQREIVMHGADYVSQQFIDENGRLGRSWGCPAFPREVTQEIIDVIKEGSCVYIYADDQSYLAKTLYMPEEKIPVSANP